MIERPTVFILGAGASCDYNFPSGRDLIFKIAEGARKRHMFQVVRDETDWMGFDIAEVIKCAEELVASELPSVDLFLENRPEYQQIGKALIARELISCENPLQFRRGKKQKWLEYLYGHMSPKKDTFTRNQIAFITFNYDRSVEHFFFTALKSSFNLADDELWAMLAQIPIIHVHGQLGSFGPQEGARAFTPDVNENTIRTAAAGIKVIHENGTNFSPEYKRAHELLSQAEIVCFLGFGYQEDNVRRLRAGTIKSYEVFAGTGFGLESSERSKAVQLVGGNLFIDQPDRDCTLFLRNQAIF